MMKQVFFEIIENSPLRADVMRLRLRGDCSAIERAGQFVNIKIEGQFLRRPLSVCDVEGDELTVCYQIKGHGTEKLAAMESGNTENLEQYKEILGENGMKAYETLTKEVE